MPLTVTKRTEGNQISHYGYGVASLSRFTAGVFATKRMPKNMTKLLLCVASAVGLTSVGTRAATTTIDFNSDPTATGLYTEPAGSAAEWRPSGGKTGGASDGYLSITDARDSQRATLVFKDLENGLIIKSFIFECDLRIGGGNERPADGFSLNFASDTDPVITGGAFAGTDGEGNLPEEGTQTGLAIGFDTWQSATIGGVQDVVGVSIRVDNRLIAQLPVPLRPDNVFLPTMPNPGAQGTQYTYDEAPYRNLATNNANYKLSMQTGARSDVNGDGLVDAGDEIDQPLWGDPTWDLWVQNLTWEKFKTEVTEDGKVKIFWKDVEITPAGGIASGFTPRAGRIIFGGRTGGNNEVTHVDNISLITQPFTSAVVQQLRGNAAGFIVGILDQGAAVLDPATLALKLNGTAITPTAVSKVDQTTSIQYLAPALLTVGTTNTVEISYKDTFGVASTATRTFVVGPYSTIPTEFAAPAGTVNTSASGFNAAIHQITVGRAPGDANSIANAERQLANRFFDPETGEVRPNVAPAGPNADGTYPVTLVNWNQTPASALGTDEGNFRDTNTGALGVADEAIPGIEASAADQGDPTLPAYNNNIVAEVTGYLDLPAGYYTFGVNSDDGFRVSTARNPQDVLGVTLGSFSGGRGASDTLFDVYVPTAGIYPVRLTWWEGGGGANVEFFAVNTLTGEKYLVNDRNNTFQIKAYPSATQSLPAVSLVTPELNQQYVFPDTDLVAQITDGTVPVNAGSVTLTLNGNAVTPAITKNGTVTTVKRDGTPSTPLPAGANSVSLVYTYTSGGSTVSVTNNWTYNVVPYGIIPASYKVAEANIDVNTPGFTARVHQLARTANTTQGDSDRFPGDGNRMPRPEIQLEEGYYDTSTGQPFPNVAIKDTDGDYFFNILDVLNFNLTVAGTAPDRYLDVPNSGVFGTDAPMPGLGNMGDPERATMSNGGLDNYVAEFTTYLRLKAGSYVFAVNSDDGFVASSAADPHDKLGTLLGFFNGGRGNNGAPLPAPTGNMNPVPGSNSGNSVFGAVVPEDGIYPIRILYWQGGGGVNLEFIQFNERSGEMALVNNTAVTWVAPAYNSYSGPARAYVKYPVIPTPWDNRLQLPGPQDITIWGRTPGSVDAGDIHNDSDSRRAFADTAIGGVFANAAGKTVNMLLNGSPVTPTVTTANGETTVAYKPAAPLPSGSTNTASLVYEGATHSWSWITQTYPTVDASAALPVSSANAEARGFRAKVAQSTSGRANTAAAAEAHLAGNPANVAIAGPEADGSYIIPGIINWSDRRNTGGSGAEVGNFQDNTLTAWPYPEFADQPVPGIPGTGTTSRDNITAEIFAYLEFPAAGYYKMAFNGDDGFVVKIGTPGVTNGQVLFTIDRGGGAADIPFSFVIPQAGLYPVRLIWYEGGGDGNVEFFSYGPNNEKIPLNANNPNAIKAYHSLSGGPAAPELTITRGAAGEVVITWTNGGTLQGSSAVTGAAWTDLDSDGSYTTTASDAAKFFRVVR